MTAALTEACEIVGWGGEPAHVGSSSGHGGAKAPEVVRRCEGLVSGVFPNSSLSGGGTPSLSGMVGVGGVRSFERPRSCGAS